MMIPPLHLIFLSEDIPSMHMYNSISLKCRKILLLKTVLLSSYTNVNADYTLKWKDFQMVM